MNNHHPSVSRGILIGVAAGIAATLVMDQFQKLTTAGAKAIEKQTKLHQGESPWQIANEQAKQEQDAANQEGSTEKVARKVAETANTTIAPENKKQAGQAVHYTFGTLMGMVYGITAEVVPEVTTGGGTAFGTLLFLGADEIAVPALKLAPPPTQNAPTDHLQHWASHVVYGGTLELVRNLLRRLV